MFLVIEQARGLCDPFSFKWDKNEQSVTHAAGQLGLSAQIVRLDWRLFFDTVGLRIPQAWLTHFRSALKMP